MGLDCLKLHFGITSSVQFGEGQKMYTFLHCLHGLLTNTFVI